MNERKVITLIKVVSVQKAVQRRRKHSKNQKTPIIEFGSELFAS